jgi:hypothetical protein
MRGGVFILRRILFIVVLAMNLAACKEFYEENQYLDSML